MNATGVLLIEPVLVGVGPPVETQHNKEGGGGHRNIIMIVCPYMVSSPPPLLLTIMLRLKGTENIQVTHTQTNISLDIQKIYKRNMSGFLSIHNKLFHSFYFIFLILFTPILFKCDNNCMG